MALDLHEPPSTALQMAADRVAGLLPQGELLGLPMERDAVAVVRARRAGRPAGVRNKRSEDVARYVIEQLGDPLLQLAALATMAADELAAATGMTVAEALAEKRLAAIAILPYLHRRMPQQVEMNHSFVNLTIQSGGGVRAEGSPSDIIDVVEIQQLSEAADDAV